MLICKKRIKLQCTTDIIAQNYRSFKNIWHRGVCLSPNESASFGVKKIPSAQVTRWDVRFRWCEHSADSYGNLLRRARLPTRKRRSNVSNPIPRALRTEWVRARCASAQKREHTEVCSLFCGEVNASIFELFSLSLLSHPTKWIFSFKG